MRFWHKLHASTTARKDFKEATYIVVGWMTMADSPKSNWPVELTGGRSYLIVGVCDSDCWDVDLALEDENGGVLASDTADDQTPVIRFNPSTTATYWIKPSMQYCDADPCGYGIGVFVQ